MDDFIDKVIDVVDVVSVKENSFFVVGWDGVVKGGLGGIIGISLNWEGGLNFKDLVVLVLSSEVLKGGFVNNLNVFDIDGWSKIFGKGVKSK